MGEEEEERRGNTINLGGGGVGNSLTVLISVAGEGWGGIETKKKQIREATRSHQVFTRQAVLV